MKQKAVLILKDSAITLLFLAAATALGCLFTYWHWQEANVVVTYLLSVLLIARFTRGYFYGIAATVFSLMLFNWFFTAPFFTLNVSDPTYTVTFLIMSLTAIITSASTSKIKEAALEARRHEAESNALYQMTNLLTDADNKDAIAAIAVKTVSEVLTCDAAIICYQEDGGLEHSFIQQKGTEQIRRELDHPDELQKRMEHLHTPFDVDGDFYNYPIYGQSASMAVLRIPKEAALSMNEEQNHMIYAIMESTALALERLFSRNAQAKIREEATQEHYRGNLLRAISHDIRTPLSGIMGNAEMLMDMTDKDDPRFDVASGIYKDADWLHALVENILNLTKLHDGHLNIQKQPEAAEEVVSAALMVLEKRFPGREIDIHMPENLLMIPMDAKLISQVLINLLDNAMKHTEEGKEIAVSVLPGEQEVTFSVADRGSGIASQDLPSVFQMFYTTRRKSPDAERGVGLGLSICQTIVEAHGGKITVQNREKGGTEFRFTLPMGGAETI